MTAHAILFFNLFSILYLPSFILSIDLFMQYGGTVYILTNHWHTVLYIGVTSNLIARVSEHKNKTHPNSFTATYNTCKLIYYESFSRIEEAIAKEKVIKKWKRQWKENMINKMNPEWKDLFDTL